jgi:hypothetical protein
MSDFGKDACIKLSRAMPVSSTMLAADLRNAIVPACLAMDDLKKLNSGLASEVEATIEMIKELIEVLDGLQ